MYARSTGDRELTFDFAGGLIKNNLLVLDRETESLWSQLHGRAIFGPLEGKPLQVVPSLQTSWGHWKRLHPDTRVMTVEDEEGRPYVYRAWKPGTPRPEEWPTEHDTSLLGLGLAVGGEAMFFPLAALEEANTPLTLRLGGQRLKVHYEPSAPTAWAENESGDLLSGVLAYRDGWMSFYPESRVLDPDSEDDSR